VSLTRLWGRDPEQFRIPLEKPLTQENVRMSQEVNRLKTRRQALLALGAGAAAVAVTALAPGSARAADVAPDDTNIEKMLDPDSRKKLTAAAKKLTKADLMKISELTTEGKLADAEKTYGLKTADINSINAAFAGHSTAAGAKKKANANISVCCCCSPCCCCAAAVTLPVRGSRTVA